MGFEPFLGNPAAVSTVRKMLAEGAMPGSLLFAGPDGVGKETLAMMLAKALNCERLIGDFCAQCPHCLKGEEMLSLSRQDLSRRREMKDASRRVDGLIYFDIQLIEPITRYILIDQIRHLRSVAYTRPFELARRVFIVDQAQAIHWQAVDLLLKVMEEPPPSTTIILVCPNAHELRPTIRSRCHHVPFLPVDDALIEGLLRDERHIPSAQLPLAVRVASGSIAAAKGFDLAEFQRRRKPWIDFLNGVTSKPSRAMEPPDWKNLFDSTKALAENRSDLEGVLKLGYSLLSDMLQVLENPSGGRVAHLDLEARLKAWAAKLRLEGIERLKTGLDDAHRLETRNVNQQLGWEALATELISPL
ncbi:MAG: ATP-binding protein [Terriglobia bacterium]